MRILAKILFIFLFVIVISNKIYSQPITNKGKEFWVSYPVNQLNGGETYVLYLSANQQAVVTVEIPCLNWTKTYTVPAGIVKVSDIIPQTARKQITGIHCSAIHITSNVSIVAYAHCYGSASSGASLLLPINSWTYDYTTLTYQQDWGSGSNSYFYFIAKENDTKVFVQPIDSATPFYITLNKGEWYQYVANDRQTDLTGSIVKSVANQYGKKNPIGFFSGASRTLIVYPCSGGGDFIMQQNFPENAWGKNYLTAPAAQSTGTPHYQDNLFRIQVQDDSTIIWINNVEVYPNNMFQLPYINYFKDNVASGKYIQFSSKTANYIKASKPIMVAQYFSGACTGVGDPEMIYLSPLEQAIRKANFYRNTLQGINTNHLTLIGASDDTLKLFDGGVVKNWNNIYVHPNYPNKSVFEADWLTSSQKQVSVIGKKNFTGITYGLGSVESYGYNVGARVGSAFEPNISGYVFYDNNKNGVKDSIEMYGNYIKVQLNDSNYTFTDINGYYELPVDSVGNYNIEIKSPNFFNALPNNFLVNVPKLDTLIKLNNVALQSVNNADSLGVHILPFWSSLAGEQSIFMVFYANLGTNIILPNLDFYYDASKMIYDSCSDATANNIPSIIHINSQPMLPGDINSMLVFLTNKTNLNTGDSLRVNANLTNGNLVAKDSSFNIVNQPFSKNIVTATPVISLANIALGKAIDYSIKFKNTTGEKVENIIIVDTLSSLLNANSVVITQASHPCKVVVTGNLIKFSFNKINLADVTAGEISAFGFINFKIKPKVSVVNGDIILNSANIYYDYNDPEFTNITQTKINVTGIITPIKSILFSAVMEKNIRLNWRTFEEKNVKYFKMQRSINGVEFNTIATISASIYNNIANDYSYIDILNPFLLQFSKVYYRLEAVDNDGFKQFSNVQVVQLSNKQLTLNITPNPASSYINILGGNIKSIEILNPLGIRVSYSIITDSNLNHKLNIQNLINGVYYVKINTHEGKSETQKININR